LTWSRSSDRLFFYTLRNCIRASCNGFLDRNVDDDIMHNKQASNLRSLFSARVHWLADRYVRPNVSLPATFPGDIACGIEPPDTGQPDPGSSTPLIVVIIPMRDPARRSPVGGLHKRGDHHLVSEPHQPDQKRRGRSPACYLGHNPSNSAQSPECGSAYRRA